MTRKKKKSVLDAFLNSPGGKTLEQAAELLKKDTPARKPEKKKRDDKAIKSSNHSLDHSPDNTDDHPVDQSVDKIPDATEKAFEKSVDLSVNQSPDHSVDHNKPKHTEHKRKALKKSPDQPTNHSVDQPVDQPPDKYVLNPNEAVLYHALLANRGSFTTVRRIAFVLGKSEHTMRKCLKRLARFGLVEYRQENLRGQQGIRIVKVMDVSVAIVGDEEKVKDALAQSRIEQISMDRPVDH